MSAPVLLNILIEFRKRDKWSIFATSFSELNL